MSENLDLEIQKYRQKLAKAEKKKEILDDIKKFYNLFMK